MPQEHPLRITGGVPGTGGALRRDADDFTVHELPLYAPSGEGEHVLFEIEKRGMSTHEAVRRIARALRTRPTEIGTAGLKDARAVTRQWLSVRGVRREWVAKLDLDGVKVLSAGSHANKLRSGHLAGNRFRVRIRETVAGAVENAHASMEILSRRGLPNRFGPQRFGERRESHLVGAALVAGDDEEVLSLMLGRPSDADPPKVHLAREAYEAGDLKHARDLLPASRRDEHACLAALIKGKAPKQAARAIPKRMRLFFISALQSHMFNRVLDERMPDVDRVEPGDLAYKHDSGAVFLVEDAEAENERAARFEISPSGPMFGYKMIEPGGRPAEIERAVLEEAGLSLESFRTPGGLKSKGERRSLRVPVEGASVEPADEADGGGIWVTFALPPGSYATVVLDEIMNTA